MKQVSGKDFVKILENHGWKLRRSRGSHLSFHKPGQTNIITVPLHGNKSLKPGTLHDLLKAAGLTQNDL